MRLLRKFLPGKLELNDIVLLNFFSVPLIPSPTHAVGYGPSSPIRRTWPAKTRVPDIPAVLLRRYAGRPTFETADGSLPGQRIRRFLRCRAASANLRACSSLFGRKRPTAIDGGEGHTPFSLKSPTPDTPPRRNQRCPLRPRDRDWYT